MTVRYDPNHHNRRSIRLRGYDYSQAGAYFITICTKEWKCLFGEIEGNKSMFNHVGRIIADSWEWLSTQYGYVDLDEYVIMPNHMHGIFVITDDGRGGSRTAPTLRSADVYPLHMRRYSSL